MTATDLWITGNLGFQRAEVERLRAELAGARRELAQLRALLATPDPLADPGYWRELFRDAHAADVEAAERRGYLAAVAEIKGVHRDLARTFGASAPTLSPWHVCCRACRRGGHRMGCRRCEDRTRETFGQPHPDDYAGSRLAGVA